MTKKLMVLAAGALAALAFMAVPSIATAGEFLGTCNGAATCTGTISSPEAVVFEEASGLKTTCTTTGGTATQSNASSTGSAKLVFSGCKESVLGTSCQSGATAGVIETNALVSHNILLEKEPKVAGVLFTSMSVTYKCPTLGVTKTVTGNVIGQITSPACGTASKTSSVRFEAGATTGSQRWTQITTSGTVFDLTTNNDAGGAYATWSQTISVTITWAAGTTVSLDC